MRYKSLIFSFFIAVIAAFGMASCTIDSSKNGNLDGAWHLLRIDDAELESKGVYWNIQAHLMELYDKTGPAKRILLRFEHEDDKLKLSEPYLYNRDDGDEPLADSTLLKPYGIEDINDPFDVLKCDGSRMILKSSVHKLEFRNF